MGIWPLGCDALHCPRCDSQDTDRTVAEFNDSEAGELDAEDGTPEGRQIATLH